MSTNILAALEHDNRGVRQAASALLAPTARIARELTGSASAVVFGALAADQKLATAPVDVVYVTSVGNAALLSHAIDSIVAAARAAAAKVILIAETTHGREVAGGVAAKLRASILTGAHALTVKENRVTVQASKLGGSILTTCATNSDAPVVILVRPNALREEEPAKTPRSESLQIGVRPRDVTIEEERTQNEERVSLEEADVVVSGGRGLGGPDPFTGMLAELANVTQGAVGASRAVVDAGWAPHAQQVGQTGKTVRPRLYFAVAISGAIQHRVGMQTAGTIVAINKDENIPIADIADLLVIGDAFSIVPELTRQLRQQKGLL